MEGMKILEWKKRHRLNPPSYYSPSILEVTLVPYTDIEYNAEIIRRRLTV